MYTVANIEKFVRDNADSLGDQSEPILQRAREKADGGVMLSAGAIEEVFGDSELAEQFHDIATTDEEHVRVAIEASR